MKVHVIPEMARQFHQLFTRGADYFNSNKKGDFTISDPAENSLQIAMLESGWMMGNITLRGIDLPVRQLKLAIIHCTLDGHYRDVSKRNCLLMVRLLN